LLSTSEQTLRADLHAGVVGKGAQHPPPFPAEAKRVNARPDAWVTMPKAAATIVLVHGAWTDASSWNKVIPILQAEGLSVIAAQLPLTSIEEDVAATTCAMADVEGPIVLVGHSWGGMAVTEAGESQKVSALVYVAAFVPDVGESGSGGSEPILHLQHFRRSSPTARDTSTKRSMAS
jgi:pimeloyl-ACP methyl ester carboxylesterase